MKNCTVCGKPLSKKGIAQGRTEHYGCRCLKRVFKKIQYGVDTNSNHYKTACKTLERNPELLNKF